jgi:hypothetical protein
MTFEEVNQRIVEIHIDIGKRTKELYEELNILQIEKKKVCPHIPTEYSKAWVDVGWDYRDSAPAYASCKDCNLIVEDFKWKNQEEKDFFYKVEEEYYKTHKRY